MFSTAPLESAAAAGLRYISGSGPCIRRIRCGKAFRYVGTDGKSLRDAMHLGRIRSLVIPPAWKNVWICPSPNGHLQAVGWDARGRKQYRYHPHYREVRDQTKFSRMIAFGTGPAAGDELHSGGERRICQGERFTWAHHHEEPSRPHRRP